MRVHVFLLMQNSWGNVRLIGMVIEIAITRLLTSVFGEKMTGHLHDPSDIPYWQIETSGRPGLFLNMFRNETFKKKRKVSNSFKTSFLNWVHSNATGDNF